jgi:hypothetical protein
MRQNYAKFFEYIRTLNKYYLYARVQNSRLIDSNLLECLSDRGEIWWEVGPVFDELQVQWKKACFF